MAPSEIQAGADSAAMWQSLAGLYEGGRKKIGLLVAQGSEIGEGGERTTAVTGREGMEDMQGHGSSKEVLQVDEDLVGMDSWTACYADDSEEESATGGESSSEGERKGRIFKGRGDVWQNGQGRSGGIEIGLKGEEKPGLGSEGGGYVASCLADSAHGGRRRTEGGKTGEPEADVEGSWEREEGMAEKAQDPEIEDRAMVEFEGQESSLAMVKQAKKKKKKKKKKSKARCDIGLLQLLHGSPPPPVWEDGREVLYHREWLGEGEETRTYLPPRKEFGPEWGTWQEVWLGAGWERGSTCLSESDAQPPGDLQLANEKPWSWGEVCLRRSLSACARVPSPPIRSQPRGNMVGPIRSRSSPQLATRQSRSRRAASRQSTPPKPPRSFPQSFRGISEALCEALSNPVALSNAQSPPIAFPFAPSLSKPGTPSEPPPNLRSGFPGQSSQGGAPPSSTSKASDFPRLPAAFPPPIQRALLGAMMHPTVAFPGPFPGLALSFLRAAQSLPAVTPQAPSSSDPTQAAQSPSPAQPPLPDAGEEEGRMGPSVLLDPRSHCDGGGEPLGGPAVPSSASLSMSCQRDHLHGASCHSPREEQLPPVSPVPDAPSSGVTSSTPATQIWCSSPSAVSASAESPPSLLAGRTRRPAADVIHTYADVTRPSRRRQLNPERDGVDPPNTSEPDGRLPATRQSSPSVATAETSPPVPTRSAASQPSLLSPAALAPSPAVPGTPATSAPGRPRETAGSGRAPRLALPMALSPLVAQPRYAVVPGVSRSWVATPRGPAAASKPPLASPPTPVGLEPPQTPQSHPLSPFPQAFSFQIQRALLRSLAQTPRAKNAPSPKRLLSPRTLRASCSLLSPRTFFPAQPPLHSPKRLLSPKELVSLFRVPSPSPSPSPSSSLCKALPTGLPQSTPAERGPAGPRGAEEDKTFQQREGGPGRTLSPPPPPPPRAADDCAREGEAGPAPGDPPSSAGHTLGSRAPAQEARDEGGERGLRQTQLPGEGSPPPAAGRGAAGASDSDSCRRPLVPPGDTQAAARVPHGGGGRPVPGPPGGDTGLVRRRDLAASPEGTSGTEAAECCSRGPQLPAGAPADTLAQGGAAEESDSLRTMVSMKLPPGSWCPAERQSAVEGSPAGDLDGRDIHSLPATWHIPPPRWNDGWGPRGVSPHRHPPPPESHLSAGPWNLDRMNGQNGCQLAAQATVSWPSSSSHPHCGPPGWQAECQIHLPPMSLPPISHTSPVNPPPMHLPQVNVRQAGLAPWHADPQPAVNLQACFDFRCRVDLLPGVSHALPESGRGILELPQQPPLGSHGGPPLLHASLGMGGPLMASMGYGQREGAQKASGPHSMMAGGRGSQRMAFRGIGPQGMMMEPMGIHHCPWGPLGAHPVPGGPMGGHPPAFGPMRAHPPAMGPMGVPPFFVGPMGNGQNPNPFGSRPDGNFRPGHFLEPGGRGSPEQGPGVEIGLEPGLEPGSADLDLRFGNGPLQGLGGRSDVMCRGMGAAHGFEDLKERMGSGGMEAGGGWSMPPTAEVCGLCWEGPKDAALVPCGHRLCHSCAFVAVQMRRACSLCNTPVREVLNLVG